MIYTSSHKNCITNKPITCAISGNRGKDAGYIGKCYPKLAPKLSFWKIWHDNIGIISEDENNKFYIEEYYKQVLSDLDSEEVYKELDGYILLCYEDNDLFCHRHIIAAWLELTLNITVKEVIVNNDIIEEVSRPSYIKAYLEEIMKKDKKILNLKSNIIK